MYTSSMFESIKEALTNSDNGGGNAMYKEILKFKAGNTYVLRLLPNIKDPKNTFYHFYVNGWNSFATGKYVSSVSLQTVGKTDPIGTEVFRLKKSSDPEERAKAEKVKWQEQWYVNVYVIDDPTNPDNNGTVKILRFGKKLNNKIMEAINGSDSDEFGARVFDLSETGVNFKLKVEENAAGFINYDSSRFTSPLSLNLSKERQEEIYNSVHDLTAISPLKSEEEIVKLWKQHFLCEMDLPSLQKRTEASDEEDDVPEPTTSKSESKSSNISDDLVKDLLKGLDDN